MNYQCGDDIFYVADAEPLLVLQEKWQFRGEMAVTGKSTVKPRKNDIYRQVTCMNRRKWHLYLK